MKYIPAICLCAALAGVSFAHTQTPYAITWMNDRISVRASEAPLADVVAEVARFTGLKVVGAEKLQGRLTVDFADLPIIAALKALLTDVNYFIQEEPDAGKGRVGLVVRVHSMARVDADAPAGAGNLFLQLPALVTLLEAEAEEIADEKQEAEEDPDVAEEHKQYLHTAQQLVANGEFDGTVSITTLEHYLGNENPEIRLEAAKALVQRPIAASLALLLEALADDSIEVRRTAINALGRASDPESLQKVGLLLQNEDLTVRYGALRILALRADPRAVVHLQKVVDDSDLTIHDGARQMLAEFERMARGKKPPLR